MLKLLLTSLLIAFALPSLSQEALRRSLAFHASFDASVNADFSRGDPRAVIKKGRDLVPCPMGEEVRLDPTGGQFGGCLHFPKKGSTRPQFSGVDVLGYHPQRWNTTVSIWLRLSPDEDLEPGYCDPVQIIGDDTRKGYLFLEFSKDETPRFFRYAVRPLIEIWNPTGLAWADIPFEKRPMVQVAAPPFSRERWTHVVFTVAGVNQPTAKPTASLYLDGRPQGSIKDWNLTLGWDPNAVALVLGASYVGRQDDLAVFDRALSDAEVRMLHQLPRGIASLR